MALIIFLKIILDFGMYSLFFNALRLKVSIAFGFKDKESISFCKHMPADN